MRRHDGARQAVALLQRRIGQHRAGADQAQRLEGDEVGIAGPDPDAIGGTGHRAGLRQASCVTGASERQPS